MVYYKLLLNNKREKADGIYPVVIRVTFNRNNTTINSGIRLKKNFHHKAYLVIWQVVKYS